MHRTLALIPAKKGSQRLPAKNLLHVGGKSLLERALIRAKDSGLFDRIFVSTEDQEIVAETLRLGFEVPFLRPVSLSKDPAGVVDVALHALDEFERRGEVFQRLVILLPTSPFCSAQDIVNSMRIFDSSNVNVLMSVTKMVQSAYTAQIMKGGLLEPLHPEWLYCTGAKATNDLPLLANSNGAITILDIEAFKKEREYYFYPMASYEMDRYSSIDIDTIEDLEYARYIADNKLNESINQ